jgi:superfamily I DNA/RNA helicase
VLFRASHHSGPLEVELTRRNIPFVKFGGLKFLEAAHIKDVLAFLRWAENPRDRVAGFRVIQLLPGVGPATAARVLDRMVEQSDPMRALSEFTPVVPENSIRRDSRGEAESAHHPMRCLRSSTCLRRSWPICSSRHAGLKSRTFFCVISSTSP